MPTLSRCLLAVVTLLTVLLAVPPGVSAVTTTRTVERFQIDYTVTNPCNGETVRITGEGTWVEQVTTAATGGDGRFVESRHHITGGGGLTGTGSVTGETYHVRLFQIDNHYVGTPGGTVEDTEVFIYLFVTEGASVDFHYHRNRHATRTPSGEVTSDTSNEDTGCRG